MRGDLEQGTGWYDDIIEARIAADVGVIHVEPRYDIEAKLAQQKARLLQRRTRLKWMRSCSSGR